MIEKIGSFIAYTLNAISTICSGFAKVFGSTEDKSMGIIVSAVIITLAVITIVQYKWVAFVVCLMILLPLLIKYIEPNATSVVKKTRNCKDKNNNDKDDDEPHLKSV